MDMKQDEIVIIISYPSSYCEFFPLSFHTFDRYLKVNYPLRQITLQINNKLLKTHKLTIKGKI
jgi:hypothetical protein